MHRAGKKTPDIVERWGGDHYIGLRRKCPALVVPVETERAGTSGQPEGHDVVSLRLSDDGRRGLDSLAAAGFGVIQQHQPERRRHQAVVDRRQVA